MPRRFTDSQIAVSSVSTYLMLELNKMNKFNVKIQDLHFGLE